MCKGSVAREVRDVDVVQMRYLRVHNHAAASDEVDFHARTDECTEVQYMCSKLSERSNCRSWQKEAAKQATARRSSVVWTQTVIDVEESKSKPKIPKKRTSKSLLKPKRSKKPPVESEPGVEVESSEETESKKLPVESEPDVEVESESELGPATPPEKPSEKLKIGVTNSKIEPFVYDKVDSNIDTKLTQFVDKCKEVGDCAAEEKAKKHEELKKTSVQTLPDKFGTVPPEKPDLEPFIYDSLEPESDTKLEEY